MSTNLEPNTTLTPRIEEQDVSWLLNISINSFDCPTQSSEARFADIRGLPIEVWRIIIEQCVCIPPEPFRWRHWGDIEDGSIDVTTLISLSHTCQFLRMIVLAMPHLWSEMDMTRSKGQVETFLERSGESHLVILLPRSLVGGRIRAIKSSIYLENHHLVDTWSNLEHLRIHSSSNQPHWDWDLSKYQRLETLDFWFPLAIEQCDAINTIGLRLKRLHLSRQGDMEMVLLALKSCITLEELRISAAWYEIGVIDAADTIRLPRLWNLSLQMIPPDAILTRLDIPVIKNLGISTGSSMKQPVVLFQVPYKKIWPLSLEISVEYEIRDLIGWIMAEPGVLRSLNLNGELSIPNACLCIDNLTTDGNGEPPCPRLENLRMEIDKEPIRVRLVTQKIGEEALTPIYWRRIRAGSPALEVSWNSTRLQVGVPRWTQEYIG